MNLIIFGVTLACSFSALLAEDVRLLDLDPPEAQQIIENKDQSLRYAPKIESNVPAVRFIGNEPRHVVEDIYLANQYHGQDGIGGYLYGYSVPDIAKTEKKKAGGDLRGAYNYVNGQGQEIKVEYWDNGSGFHQIDNVPKILPKQIDDTPEVKAAKEEHARIWREQALRNSQPVAYPFAGNQYKPEIASQIGAQGSTPGLLQPQFQPGQYPTGGSYQNPGVNVGAGAGDINNVDYSGQYTEPKAAYVKPHQEEEEEVTGPPKGFFYNFDYPVGIIVGKEGTPQIQKRESISEVYSKSKEFLEKQLQEGSKLSGSNYPQYFVTS